MSPANSASSADADTAVRGQRQPDDGEAFRLDERRKFRRESEQQPIDRKTTDEQGRQPGEKTATGIRGTLRKHPVAALVAAGIALAVAVGGIVWYLHARHYESTDDAFIDSRPVLITPQITGNIVEVHVSDNQVVRTGDLLARIDPRDYKAAVDQAAAQIRQAEATIKNVYAQIAAQESQIEQASKQVTEAEAALRFAQDENTRYQDLVQKGAGTLQRAQQASSDFQGKQAALDAAVAAKTSAERRIDVLKTQNDEAVAQRDQSRAQKDRADANLERTELRATTDGHIAKLTAAVGALAAPGQAIMVLVPIEVWVTANFKESQLADMRVGQPVDIHVDAFGRAFPGHVDSVQAGSGTAFSLLPAENATGNYVKVVQRVPVKITFDQRPDVEMGPGMSVVPTVTVRP
jgi:membrane fusion protein, multidrug efflux system